MMAEEKIREVSDAATAAHDAAARLGLRLAELLARGDHAPEFLELFADVGLVASDLRRIIEITGSPPSSPRRARKGA